MNWIAEYVEAAGAAKICTRIHCTTCGALNFRQGLVRRASDVAGTNVSTWDDDLAALTAEGLVPMSTDFTCRHIEATRFVFFELWSAIGDTAFRKIVEARVEGTPAGEILQAMRDHSARVELSRRIEAERCDPMIAQRRRDAKKVEKAAAHAARLAAKEDRDRAFRANMSQGTLHRQRNA